MKYLENIILFIVVALIAFIVGLLLIKAFVYVKANNDKYNAQVCATYGLKPDCVTPLASK